MIKAALLIILLSNGGYWFGGENRITLKWATPEAGTPAAVVVWKLSYGALQVAAGEAEVAAGEKETALKLQLPTVRVLTTFEWSYELREKQTGKVLERGSREIHLVPPKILERVAERVKARKVVVVEGEGAEGMTAVLQGAGIEARRVGAVGDLQLAQGDIILVGEEQVPENLAAQEVLLGKARQGAGVMVFAQRVNRIGEWELRSRKTPATLSWRVGHGLVDSFSAAALDGWAKEKDGEAKVLALPAEAGVLELGYVPRETPGDTPVPIDALAATQTIGEGRMVYWQIPIASWKGDPRAQLLLANALDYLLTRPEPTLPQSQRQSESKKPAKQPIGAEP